MRRFGYFGAGADEDLVAYRDSAVGSCSLGLWRTESRETGKGGGFREAGGFKADGFLVETTSEEVLNEDDTSAEASRMGLALEGSRAFTHGTRHPDAGPGDRAAPRRWGR